MTDGEHHGDPKTGGEEPRILSHDGALRDEDPIGKYLYLLPADRPFQLLSREMLGAHVHVKTVIFSEIGLVADEILFEQFFPDLRAQMGG